MLIDHHSSPGSSSDSSPDLPPGRQHYLHHLPAAWSASPEPLAAALAAFVAAHPEYERTTVIDEVRAREFERARYGSRWGWGATSRTSSPSASTHAHCSTPGPGPA